MTLKQIREARARTGQAIQDFVAAHTGPRSEWSEEDRSAWDAMNAEFDSLRDQEEVAARAEEVAAHESRIQAPGGGNGSRLLDAQFGEQRREDPETPTQEHRNAALAGWMLNASGEEVPDECQRAAEICGINIHRNSMRMNLLGNEQMRAVRREFRQATPYTSTAPNFGGQTIPEGFQSNLERALLAYGSVRQNADVIRTTSGNDLPWPTNDATSQKGSWMAEVTDSDGDPAPELAVTTNSITWKAHGVTSKIVRVTRDVIQDSAFNMVQVVSDIMGERLGRITEEGYTTGDGDGKPTGILVASTLGKLATSASVLDETDIYDLIHSVDPAYRADPSCGFMFHDSITRALRGLRDSDGRPLWQGNLADGVPERLGGWRMAVNQEMPSTIAAGNKIMLFGALSKYKIRDVQEITFLRSEHRYMEFNQEGFVIFMRTDGNLLNAGTNPVKYLQMAAS
jgi:HK97 family phage major capsid protein